MQSIIIALLLFSFDNAFASSQDTYVIIINGDSDRFSSEEGGALRSMEKILADEVTRQATSSPRAANVVLLVDQRGTDRWYTRDKFFRAYTKIFSQGRRIKMQSDAEVDLADPKVYSDLLRQAEKLFPQSRLHFIYSGHSFFPNYVPGYLADQDSFGLSSPVPMDLSHQKSFFGVSTLAAGIRGAALKNRLVTLTLISCHMARLEVARKLSPLSHYLIASSGTLYEAPDLFPNFDFIGKPSDQFYGNHARNMANDLLRPYLSSDQLVNSQSLSVINLDLVAKLDSILVLIGQELKSLASETKKTWVDEITAEARAAQYPSQNAIKELENEGMSSEDIAAAIDLLKVNGPLEDDLDLGTALEKLKSLSNSTVANFWIQSARKTLAEAVRVAGKPPYDPGSGILFHWDTSIHWGPLSQ